MNSACDNPRVAFQGERGAFGEEAALALLGPGARPVACPTFEATFAAVAAGSADCALVPVENTLAGEVKAVRDLLLESGLVASGEIVRPIAQCLVGVRGAALERVRTVESHPVALAQCGKFFAARPHVRRVSSDDTAASVRRVVERGDPALAAIASARAALIYGGEVLLEHVEDRRENYTRFLLLAPSAEAAGAGCHRQAQHLINSKEMIGSTNQ